MVNCEQWWEIELLMLKILQSSSFFFLQTSYVIAVFSTALDSVFGLSQAQSGGTVLVG